MSTIRLSARLGAAVAALAVPFVLVACGADNTPTSPQTGTQPGAATSAPAGAQVSSEHNDADVRFAQTMIPHHQQAVEMADMATERATSAEVKDLATQIRSAQDPEIATMTGFLQTWGAEVPATGALSGMDHGNMTGMDQSGMPGMMTPEQMQQLGGATGASFDTMFLQMMISHHQGAVTDAQRELTEGTNPEAKALASQIIEGQTAEITRMQQLLQAG
jgi:uncharacterized protein (DUF305 family)